MRFSWTSKCQNINGTILGCIPKSLMTQNDNEIITINFTYSLISMQAKIKFSTFLICLQVKIKYGFVIYDIRMSRFLVKVGSHDPPHPHTHTLHPHPHPPHSHTPTQIVSSLRKGPKSQGGQQSWLKNLAQFHISCYVILNAVLTSYNETVF